MGELDGDGFQEFDDFGDPRSESPLPPFKPTYENDNYLSLDTIKDHLNIERSNPDRDDQLQRLARSSYAWAIGFLNRPLHTLDDNSPPSSPFVIPEDLQTAMLLHIEAYLDRDPVQMTQLIEAAENLAYQYRRGVGV